MMRQTWIVILTKKLSEAKKQHILIATAIINSILIVLFIWPGFCITRHPEERTTEREVHNVIQNLYGWQSVTNVHCDLGSVSVHTGDKFICTAQSRVGKFNVIGVFVNNDGKFTLEPPTLN